MRKWESPKLFNLGLEFTYGNVIEYYPQARSEYGFRCKCCGHESGYIYPTLEQQIAAAESHKNNCEKYNLETFQCRLS